MLVILSDGEDHGGGLEAEGARLKEEGVAVYAFGIGTPNGAPLPLPGAGGGNGEGKAGYKKDADGNVVISRLHEDVLESLTRSTGGSYTRVTSAALDPAPVVARIDAMEKRTLESHSVTTLEERFQWPLAAAAAALFLYLAIGPFAPRERHA